MRRSRPAGLPIALVVGSTVRRVAREPTGSQRGGGVKTSLVHLCGHEGIVRLWGGPDQRAQLTAEVEGNDCSACRTKQALSEVRAGRLPERWTRAALREALYDRAIPAALRVAAVTSPACIAGGRPPLRPWRRASINPAVVRSRISARSNCAMAPNT